MKQQKKRNRHPSCRCGTGSYCAWHGLYSASPGLVDVDGVALSEPSRYADEEGRQAVLRAPTEHGAAGGGRRIIRKQIGGA